MDITIVTSWLQFVATVILALVTGIVGWVLKEVISLRVRCVAMETTIQAMGKDCVRHQNWLDDLSKTASRVDRNVSRLCQKSGVQETT